MKKRKNSTFSKYFLPFTCIEMDTLIRNRSFIFFFHGTMTLKFMTVDKYQCNRYYPKEDLI